MHITQFIIQFISQNNYEQPLRHTELKLLLCFPTLEINVEQIMNMI